MAVWVTRRSLVRIRAIRLYHDKAIGCYNACADVAVVSTSRSVSSESGGRKR